MQGGARDSNSKMMCAMSCQGPRPLHHFLCFYTVTKHFTHSVTAIPTPKTQLRTLIIFLCVTKCETSVEPPNICECPVRPSFIWQDQVSDNLYVCTNRIQTVLILKRSPWSSMLAKATLKQLERLRKLIRL